MKTTLARLLLLLDVPHAFAASNCSSIHGKIEAWNGTPGLRITARNHTYGIVDSANHPLPDAIAKAVDFDHSAIGRFTLCRLGQAKPHGMIYVWAAKADIFKIVRAQ